MTELYEELGYERELEGVRATVESVSSRAFGGMLSDEDENLVATIREALTKTSSAVSSARSGGVAPPSSAIVGALGGAEFVMRGEIMAGRTDQLPRLLPSFSYLVTLPFVGHEEALRVARRTEELLDGAG
jgi:hypothetical protein